MKHVDDGFRLFQSRFLIIITFHIESFMCMYVPVTRILMDNEFNKFHGIDLSL